jgi:hypothetical protein
MEDWFGPLVFMFGVALCVLVGIWLELYKIHTELILIRKRGK